jgi:hypothetical protein
VDGPQRTAKRRATAPSRYGFVCEELKMFRVGLSPSPINFNVIDVISMFTRFEELRTSLKFVGQPEPYGLASQLHRFSKLCQILVV